MSVDYRAGALGGLFDHRLIFVTGKGGVGKSTVAMAIAIAGTRRGLRTIVAEVASQDRIQRAFEAESQLFTELELSPGLFAISIDPELAMEEYLRVKTGALGRALGSTKVFRALTMATPGMREMQTIAKIWELAQADRPANGTAGYDLVVVDAPATGHGVALLRTPRTFAEIARVGPVAQGGRMIAEMVADHEFTGLVAVATPEEMAVNETLALRDALALDGLKLDAVILNRLYPERFDASDVAELQRGAAGMESEVVEGAIQAALFEHRRAVTQGIQVTRLLEAVDVPLLRLPYLFVDDLDRKALEGLADTLEDAVAAHPKAGR